MLRKIISIDEEKCNGCGLCVTACHEGALQLINGKARLISESYCDGLGDCLPECPTDAITLEEKETVEYDEEAVKRNMEKRKTQTHGTQPCGCPGTQAKLLARKQESSSLQSDESSPSQLNQWPCQLKLIPINASYLDNAHLLIAADCTAFAYPAVHQKFMRNKITLIGCPKLDDIDYSEKLTAILKQHEIKSVTVLRMEVPCCGGIVQAVKKSLINSETLIPWHVVTISTDGRIIEE
ncbi:4Fe-4S protein [Desulfosporosinus orientis DSM 765]|uniref:4Fe-4S protein n=1 Tax=Desulfosporosinus orientis (strain ATCC 19365 / DSM 765 / NCIMB 8382 / VKM B-1628 / Singapore I) TaxID=768706 RepID=G7WIQ5_DESOD|nr:4Fe-4S binding protein [Desulfosporosinus orientis]AET69129.1 4Fe-4S protein [Desulfosporosinus orientis DSM 765]